MKPKTDLGRFHIQGLIIPVAWDEKGNVLAVAISTFDEDEYLIDRDEKGEQLLGLLREEVKVSGVVGLKDGVKTIKVTEYVLNKMSELIEGALEEHRAGHTNGEFVPKQGGRGNETEQKAARVGSKNDQKSS